MCDSLYALVIKSVVKDLTKTLRAIDGYHGLTARMRFDLYWALFKRQDIEPGILDYLSSRLADLRVFNQLLTLGERRVQLFQMCHATFNFDCDNCGCEEPSLFLWLTHESRDLTTKTVTSDKTNWPLKRKAVTEAMAMAQFFADSGWYVSAVKVLRAVESACQHLSKRGFDSQDDRKCLDLLATECRLRLLHAFSAYCNFTEADKIYNDITSTFEQTAPCRVLRSGLKIPKLDFSDCVGGGGGGDKGSSSLNSCLPCRPPPGSPASLISLPAQYLELAYHCFVKSHYHLAYDWAMKAVMLLTSDLSPKVIIDVLRVASKACVVKGLFAKAKLLIHEAVLMAKEIYGEFHPKYADCLIDFGFYLQNSDGASASIQAYESALKIRESIFGRSNLKTAQVHEDVAYATYVYEYSSGHFSQAIAHADKALDIMRQMLPENHLLMASAKRVCALILEEIAIDSRDDSERDKKLGKAERLHLSALALAKAAFGEMNIQTAKHYGNLGRLYQSMDQCKKAEKMHQKAIGIKERLLGKDDYEVALSIGHLASLYNYDMKEFEKARALHSRSIDLGIKLFGPGYSGLEYDYRGMIRIYTELGDLDKMYEFRMKLENWKNIRAEREEERYREPHLLADLETSQPISLIVSAVSPGGGGSGSGSEELRFNFNKPQQPQLLNQLA